MAKRIHFLKEWRKFRGLTQEQMSEAMGVTQGQVSKIEGEKKDVELSFLIRAADVLRCDVADLLKRDPSQPEPLWAIVEGMTAPQLGQLSEIAKTLKRTG